MLNEACGSPLFLLVLEGKEETYERVGGKEAQNMILFVPSFALCVCADWSRRVLVAQRCDRTIKELGNKNSETMIR